MGCWMTRQRQCAPPPVCRAAWAPYAWSEVVAAVSRFSLRSAHFGLRSSQPPPNVDSKRVDLRRAEQPYGNVGVEAPYRAVPSRDVPCRAEPCRAQPSRAEPCRAEPSRAEHARARACVRYEPGQRRSATGRPLRSCQSATAAPHRPRTRGGRHCGRCARPFCAQLCRIQSLLGPWAVPCLFCLQPHARPNPQLVREAGTSASWAIARRVFADLLGEVVARCKQRNS
jgi:hypothetical protein